ncbi:class I SAM-dependent rRNA methyltransferase [Haploplasma axanthum]|uniref:Protoporphyrinogen oxidase n=1 Tax=Haploplasma axanthum TaxID=29552 RepID=A0A449BFK7_HAPAX|nr:class I SAM-dependent rRNA methyltransferase [Haploplasma axanthum]VEU81233.1 protoporphyrinogen oxidase [Haploplasma axanthum]
MEICKIYLKKKEEERLLKGHSWVFGNEIDRFEGKIKSGDIAYVYSSKGEFIGKGFLNTTSKIFVRLLTRNENQVIDKNFFYELIYRSNKSRVDLGYSNSYRVLFGESDGVPGFIIDKYDEYLVVQILSYGIDLIKEMLIEILVEIFNPKGIYERSDAPVRKKEGLELFKGTIYGEVPDRVLIKENHLDMYVDVKNGQKTGTFLDQQDNYNAIKPYVKNKDVLDCFSNIGGFGLHALSFGAKNVTCVDISEHATNQIKENATLNNYKVETVTKDVFSLLREYQTEGKKFDTIILDPPAFAKKNDDTKKAYQGYKDINLNAMKLINEDGYLITCSCSYFMNPALFMEMVMDAASDAKKVAQMIEFRTQSKDHPALLGSDESFYLKILIVRIKSL